MKTTEQIETKRGYHFTGNTLRNGDPIPAIGEWISVKGAIIPCESGLHMSEHPFDALKYAPGYMLHLVDIMGNLQPHWNPIDKWVGRYRRIIATINATDILRGFARFCALSVAHLWDCPDVVLRYLETGDESIRAAARDSAWDSSRAVDSERTAAVAAAFDSALDSALDSARAVAVHSALALDSAWDSAMSSLRGKFKSIVDEAFEKELSK